MRKNKRSIIPYIEKSIPENFLTELDPKEIYINPTGQFIMVVLMVILASQVEKLLWILMVEQHHMEGELFLERIQQK